MIVEDDELHVLSRVLYASKFGSDSDSVLWASPLHQSVYSRTLKAIRALEGDPTPRGVATYESELFDKDRWTSHSVLHLVRRRLGGWWERWGGMSDDDRVELVELLLFPYRAPLELIQRLISHATEQHEVAAAARSRLAVAGGRVRMSPGSVRYDVSFGAPGLEDDWLSTLLKVEADF